MACVELGWRCSFVARGRSPADALRRFWVHARREHGRNLALWSVQQKEQLSDLVDALAHSERSPRHKRPSTSPGLRALEESGVVRRWWC